MFNPYQRLAFKKWYQILASYPGGVLVHQAAIETGSRLLTYGPEWLSKATYFCIYMAISHTAGISLVVL